MSRTTATCTSKMLPELYNNSNDIESRITKFELLDDLQILEKAEKWDGTEVETFEQPQFFSLRLQKSATIFNRTLTEA